MNADLRVALDWLAAVSDRDRARLLELSDAEIALHGPQGVNRGTDVLERWFETVHLRITPREAYLDGGRILIVHDMDWLGVEDEVTASMRNATVFEIENGLVTAMQRDDEPEAVPRLGFGDAEPAPVAE